MTPSWKKLAALKTTGEFREYLSESRIELPVDDVLDTGADAPLWRRSDVEINGKFIANRFAVHPMEGWDGTQDGQPTAEVRRRWSRFGESGAGLIWGGEAMAVCPEGRANPNQLVISPAAVPALGELCQAARESHRQSMPESPGVVIGFQLTHSGRFCRPDPSRALRPRIAFSHPILDRRWNIDPVAALLRDDEVPELVRNYVEAAGCARDAGADFVDIKHCHGYLLHEFLGAHTRTGPYGGPFENRTRILREIVSGIRAAGNPIAIGVRLSAFDFIPFRPDPERGEPGKPGPGIPEIWDRREPYRFGFAVNFEDPVQPDLSESIRFLELCRQLGIRLVNLTAGSPYYNPHIQRPAAFPPSDGYQPAHDPLVDVARQLATVRELKRKFPDLFIVGSGYSYLQEFLPHVAQGAVRQGWADSIGLGRMILSYPTLPRDVLSGRPLQKKQICRTFSDCTTAPRNGMISGCFPLDSYYSTRPEAARLKELKKSIKALA